MPATQQVLGAVAALIHWCVFSSVLGGQHTPSSRTRPQSLGTWCSQEAEGVSTGKKLSVREGLNHLLKVPEVGPQLDWL